MTDRERLVELMIEAKRTDPETGSFTDYLADYLIEHGVTVLPCKVGDTVYMIKSNEIISCTVISINYNSWGIPTNLHLRHSEFNGCSFIPMQCTDGFVFLTREEAEKALKEREQIKGFKNNINM